MDSGGGRGGQGGCEQRSEVIAEMQKKKSGVGGGQVRPGMGGVEGWGLVDREGVGWYLVAMLGIGGDVGYGG